MLVSLGSWTRLSFPYNQKHTSLETFFPSVSCAALPNDARWGALLLSLWSMCAPARSSRRNAHTRSSTLHDVHEGGREGGGSGVWPSMVTHTRNLSSAFNPSKCTLTAVNTHPEQWAAMLRRPGSSWGIGALLKGLTSVVVLKVERALVIHSPHRQSLPDLGIEPATFGLQVQLSNH